jgi:hypothetical protein
MDNTTVIFTIIEKYFINNNYYVITDVQNNPINKTFIGNTKNSENSNELDIKNVHSPDSLPIFPIYKIKIRRRSTKYGGR